MHLGTQAPNGRRLGSFTRERWTDGETTYDELALYADLCLAAGWEQVALTTLHELVHLWENRIAGSEPSPDYHRAAWHKEARRVGLATRGPKGATEPTEQFRADLARFDVDANAIPWRLRDAPKPSKLKRLRCGCTTIRAAAGVDVDAVCMKCALRFVESPTDRERDNDGDDGQLVIVVCPECGRDTPAELFDARRECCRDCDSRIRNVGRIVAHVRGVHVPDRIVCQPLGVGSWRVALADEPPPF